MNIIFSGGGTGGHIYPALAMKEILQDKLSFSSYYIGINNGLEEKIVSRENDITFLGVRAQGMPRKPGLKWLSFPFVNTMGVIDALRHLLRVKPHLVITTGGYVAFPVLAASRILSVPVILHEQNAAMGVTNRLFAGYAKKVLLTYESAAETDSRKVFLTGNPVRKTFLQAPGSRSKFASNSNQKVLLAVGGSGGALSLNKACVELAKDWLVQHPEFLLLHISGERDYEYMKQCLPDPPHNYKLIPYLHEMKEAFDAADILISRAGATILAEIAVCKKPSILIPYPYATDNHQEKNARMLQESGAAIVLLDSELSAKSLSQTILSLNEAEILQKMATAMGKSRPEDVEERIFKQISAVIETTSNS